MTNIKSDNRICRKHLASSYLIERMFVGNRSATDVVADLVKVHCA